MKSWELVPILVNMFLLKTIIFRGQMPSVNRICNGLWITPKQRPFGVRGGYGSVRILDNLNFDAFKKQPKWLIGYSDITALHNRVQLLGFESIHGMMAVNMEDDRKAISSSIESLKSSLLECKYLSN